MKKLLLGLIISAVLVYLSFRGIDKKALWEALRRMDYYYILGTFFILFLMQLVRSVRWGFLLAPLQPISQRVLFAITSVGFLAIAIIPARVGELARPYLITKKSEIPMSSALATIFSERLLDSITVLILLAIAILVTPLPSWLVKSGIFVLSFTVITVTAIIFVYVKRELVFHRLLSGKNPARGRWERLIRVIERFVEGFKIVTDLRGLALAGILSLLFWVLDIFSIYLLLKAFHLQLPLIAAVVIMLILLVGIVIPTAPGFIGNWHFSCVIGLSLFGVPKADALSFAIVYHFVSMALIVGLGLVFLPSYAFRWGEIKNSMRG